MKRSFWEALQVSALPARKLSLWYCWIQTSGMAALTELGLNLYGGHFLRTLCLHVLAVRAAMRIQSAHTGVDLRVGRLWGGSWGCCMKSFN